MDEVAHVCLECSESPPGRALEHGCSAKPASAKSVKFNSGWEERLMSTEGKENNGQVAKGTSGNPAGRPTGSRNHATLLMEAMLEGESHELTRKAIDLGKAGNTYALRLCLDRLMPAGKDRLVHFELPPIRGLEDVPAAM